MMRRLHAGATIAALVALLTATVTAQLQTEISLRISQEVVRPGAIAQVKISITEPRPISTGGMFIDFGAMDDFLGFATVSAGNDAYGTAQQSGTGIRFSINSPSATVGTDGDYPLATVAVRVPAAAQLGTTFPIATTNGFIRLVGPLGKLYTADEVKDGSITVRQSISIDDVIPGSAVVPAGGVVTVVGHGFQPNTKVRFGGVLIASTQFVDASHFRVVLASAARMHGVRVRAENPNGPRTTYFSYQRTQSQGATRSAALAGIVPLFPLQLMTRARIDLTGTPAGVGLQNLDAATASVHLDLLSPSGQVLATKTTTVQPNRYKVRELSEWFGTSYATPARVRVRSTVPIQVVGIRVDASGDASPVIPTPLQ